MSSEQEGEGWFYVDQNREKQGPFSVQDFKALADQGLILNETLIWSNGYPNWVAARELTGLVSQPETPTPPSLASPANIPQPQEEKLEPIPDEELKPRKGSFLFHRFLSGFLIALVLGIAVAVGCYFLEVTPFAGLAAFALLLALFVFGSLVAYRKERYQLTSSTVLSHSGGLASDQTTEVEICNITHVAMKLPWLRHKLFGIGSIEIESAGTSQPVVLRSVTEPEKVYQRITERMKRNGYQLKQAELLHEEKPAIRGILVNFVQIGFGVLVAIFFSWTTVVGFHEGISSVGLGWISYLGVGLFTLIALAYLVIYFLDMRQRMYRVYNDVVIYEEGFLTRRKAFIPYENIADAATNRTFLDQVFNLFDVVISCQGSSSEIKFRRLKEGIHLTDSIEQLVTEANRNPSPAELMAKKQTSASIQEIPTRDEPTLVSPGEEWIADLGMSPLRVFIPLLILLPVFPLWILAMIQAGIKLWSTRYEVREASIKHSYRFLTTVEREFAYDKITGLVVKQNLIDKMLGTFTLRFWSIGSSQSLELAHVHRSLVDLDALLQQIGIPSSSENVREIATEFGFGSWLRARCLRLFLALLATIAIAATGFFMEESLLYLAAGIVPLLCLLGFGYAWTFYSCQKLSFQDHHIEAEQGIIAKRFYFARYRNVKQNLVTRYPGGQKGSLQIFIAGEQIVGQQGEQKGQSKVAIPCSFTLGFLPDALAQGQLLDDVLMGRVEVNPECVAAEPLEILTESKRGLGNSVFALILWSLLLFPLLILLPLTLPLTIMAKKRWRYQVEAGRVVASWGLLFKKQATILLDRVDSLQQRQGVLNKIFKNGTVSIMTAGSSKPDLILSAAKTYQSLYKEIRQLSQNGN